jgi:hypothetical protein
MNLDLILPIITNIYLYNNKYHPLINCIIITLSSFLKLIFYDNYIIHKILEISTLTTILYYFIDTIKILSNKINIFVLHHICACHLLISYYIFNYNIYILYILLFIIELSGLFYIFYCHKLITSKTHKLLYVPLRTCSNILLLYYIIYEMKYTYHIELLLNLIAFFLLFMFNIGGILKCLKLI